MHDDGEQIAQQLTSPIEALNLRLAGIQVKHASALARLYADLGADGKEVADEQVRFIGSQFVDMENYLEKVRALVCDALASDRGSVQLKGAPSDQSSLSNSDQEKLANFIALDAATQAVATVFSVFQIDQSVLLDLVAQPLMEWARNQSADALLADYRVAIPGFVNLEASGFDNSRTGRLQRGGAFRPNRTPKKVIQEVIEAAEAGDNRKVAKALVELDQTLQRMTSRETS